LIRLLFSEEAAAEITKIPLSTRDIADTLFWWPNKRGCFTVKSVYWLGMLGTTDYRGRDKMMDDVAWWKKVWGLNILPKMKHFLWRTCKDFLAVNARLKSKRIREDGRCNICNGGDEPISHVFFECCQARRVWAESEFTDIRHPFCASYRDAEMGYGKNWTREDGVFHLYCLGNMDMEK